MDRTHRAANDSGATEIRARSPLAATADLSPPCRLLVVPGLRDSSAMHWQTWLQLRHPGALRVYQRHWSKPDLDTWAARIGETIAAAGPGPLVAAAHGFGCLALMHHLNQGSSRIRFALLVAPSDPKRFGLASRLPTGAPLLPSTLLASENDPGMPIDQAREWASRWGSRLVNLGAAGHVDAAAGFGPFPDAAALVERAMRGVDGSPRQAPLAASSPAGMARPPSAASAVPAVPAAPAQFQFRLPRRLAETLGLAR